MGRRSVLSLEEKSKIEAYFDAGLSLHKIAEKTGRHRKTIAHFLKDKENYGKNYKGGNNRVVSQADKRAILRNASNSHDSSRKIREKSGVNVSLSTVQRVIKNAEHLQRKKLKKKPPLNAQRKQMRMEFARTHMSWTTQWHYVAFSDEKKFNLEGPDGYNYYFHDLRKDEHTLDRLHSREGGVMVWGAITYYGTCELQFLTSRMNAENYKNVLQIAFPHLQNLFGNLNWHFQHDNAPIHTARTVKSWIQSQEVEILEWPPYSPDLNIIENVWGWLARKVYESGKQYKTKYELIEGIKEAWSTISLNYINQLYQSIPCRVFEVISKNGGSTHY